MKPTTIALALVLTALVASGCAEPGPASSSIVPSTTDSTPTASLPAQPPISLTYGFLGNTTTTNATLDYFVKADQGVSVQLSYNGTLLEGQYVDGRYGWTLQLAFGTKPFRAEIATPTGPVVEATNITRLAETRLTIDWSTFHPDSLGAAREIVYTVWADMDARPSSPDYEAKGAAQQDFYTAHDQLRQWSTESGLPIQLAYFASLQGFAVDKIDGAGSEIQSGYPPSWCYKVNGEIAGLGMSMTPVAPSDHIEWILGTGFC